MRRLRRTQDERGAVLVFVALAMVVLIGSTALAVDIGQLTNKNRDLQAVADAVSLDAARAIDGSNVAVLSGPGGPVTLAAQDSARRNGDFPFALLDVELGSITGTSPFIPATDPAAIPNAVRVTANDTVDFSFAPGERTTDRQASAVREATESVGFSVGSFLASVDTRGNAILNSIFGSSFGTSATVLGYGGLVGSSVNLGALAAEAGFGSPTELLASSISARDLLLASADALPQDGTQTANINLLNTLAATASTTSNIQLGRFITIEQPGDDAAAAGQLDVLGLLTSSAFLIDGTHLITLPGTTVGVPGVTSVVLDLYVIEAAKTVFGPVGTFAETAQANLTITPTFNINTSANVNGCSLRGTLNALLSLSVSEALTCTLGGVVSRIITLNVNGTAPIQFSAAGARATLVDIACDTTPETITLDPEPVPLSLVSTVDVNVSGTLAGTSLGNVFSVRATADATASADAGDQTFANPLEFGVPRRATADPLGLAGLTTFTVSDVALLNTDVGPVLNALATPVVPLVNQALGDLDSLLIGPLNELLGINLGGADLTAIPDSLQCDRTAVRLAE
jgi:uncharacterized membrane protein